MFRKKLLILLAYLLVLPCLVPGQGKNYKLNKTNYYHQYTRFNINNISTFIYNNGIADHSNRNVSGLVYPKGTGKTACFQSGFVWGGKVEGQFRVGGSTYSSGLQPGKIISPGVAADTSDHKNRVYRVRPDYKTADLSSEIKDGEGTFEQIKAQYAKDWNEWPAAEGAPFQDIDGDGKYNPQTDIPGVPGAGQTLWFVANDLDSSWTNNFYGSPPIGVEIQATIWGGYSFLVNDALDNTIFKQYKIINKSGKEITGMYLGYWADVDDGDATDDVDGCDTLLDLGYTYNFNPVDAVYGDNGFGSTPPFLPPPAVGFALLEGPVVPGLLTDTAFIFGSKRYGYKNLPMTSVGYVFKHAPGGDAPLGRNYVGTIYMHNFFQGKLNDSAYIPVPQQFGGGYSVFPFSGDPETQTGWLDGIDYYPADRRIMINSGTFNMAPGDTQQVVYAEILAGARTGDTNLSAVTLLKQYTGTLRDYFRTIISNPPVPNIPIVNATALDQSVVLTWSNSHKEVSRVEEKLFENYDFEGYNVYQLPNDSANISEGIKIDTFDKVDGIKIIYNYKTDPLTGIANPYISQSGMDSGIQRFIKINQDYLHGGPLHNGSKYYFGVTGYSYKSDTSAAGPNSYESHIKIATIVPGSNSPGERFGAVFGTQLNSTHLQGNSSGKVEPVVIDPANLLGHTYEVTFKIINNDTVWSLTDNTTNTIRLENQKNQSGDDDYLIIDGLLVKVINDKNNPNTPSDIFTFNSPKTAESKELAKEDVQKITVFPNPYYVGRQGTYITFSHLPEKATIRIYDLSGWLVKTIEKDGTDQFYRYDLRNNSNALLGSGVYVAFVDMPALGTTKIVKFTVIQ